MRRSKVGFKVIIPARHASTRLPGKPLLDIAGKPMIQHVFERAQASSAEEVVVATDDERIRTVAESGGAHVCMTAVDHPSGTDRLAEAVTLLGYGDEEIVVNVQGDEPLIPVGLIEQVAVDLAAHRSASVATLCERIRSAAEIFDPHVVKVVRSKEGDALYFSRAAIPWDRDAFTVSQENGSTYADHYRHIGIYAYRVGFLKRYVQWSPSPLEQMESLEQLRVLWYGEKIHVVEAQEPPAVGVDTLQDLEHVRRILNGQT
jgi:3-deoxy-manno-octulosonate cytidylyltransferase (CMP-KDO synthetase)